MQLSDERTITRWAYAGTESGVYVEPRSGAKRLARLRYETEDGFPEVYLLLRSRRDASGTTWIELRVPGRPNGRVGWVRAQSLSSFQTTHKLLVLRRNRLRIYLYDRGRRVFSAPVGIGRPSAPTPAGRFWIRERFKVADRSSGYWPYALGTAAYSNLSDWPGGGVVGIHGPYNEPERIPGRPSHGCIRLRARDAARLAPRVPPGTPLRII